MFSMNELSSRVNVSKQRLYKLIKENQGLSTLIEEHSTRQGRFVLYDEVVLEWLMKHYNVALGETVETGVPLSSSEEDTASVPNDTARVKELEQEIEDLKSQIKELSARLELSERDKRELQQSNGALILTVQQMTNTAFQQYQASVKMLPPAKVPLVERIKAVFTRKGAGDKS